MWLKPDILKPFCRIGRPLRLAGSRAGVSLLAVVLFNGGCKREPPAETLDAFIGDKARLVWVRQIEGDGSDPFCETDRLVLMGLDGGAPDEASPILPDIGNYRKPMITPDGTGIVFTRITEYAFYYVNWDGTGLKRLGSGNAANLWKDPQTGVVWVYYIAGPVEGDNYVGRPVTRCRLDAPETKELVWDKTMTGPDNLQLSKNGRLMAGLYPWPLAGVVEVANQKMSKIGQGCWVSISPDNRYLMWVFDGAHKNLMMRSLDGSNDKKVRINSIPGGWRSEVYHPRWSNHPDYLIITGPYRNKGRYNNIGGGGKGINVFVGRFNDKFSKVESWFQASDHPDGDFYPDLWIEGGAVPASGNDTLSVGPVVPVAVEWPPNRDGLVYVWHTGKEANGIEHPERGYYRCDAVRKGKARYNRFHEMDLTEGCFLAQSAVLPETDSSFTLMLNIRPAQSLSSASGIVAAMGQAALLQSGKMLYWKNGSGGDGEAPVPVIELQEDIGHHISVSYSPGEGVRFYHQGQPVSVLEPAPDQRPAIRLAGRHGLSFGGLPDGDADWPGFMDGIAIYDRVLSPAEVAAGYEAYVAAVPEGREQDIPRLVIDARLKEISPMPTPEGIAPYRSALVEYLYETEHIVEGEISAGDQVIVQHWAILDAETYPLNRSVGKIYRLVLESIEDHPELEGERVSSELIEPVDIYLDVATE